MANVNAFQATTSWLDLIGISAPDLPDAACLDADTDLFFQHGGDHRKARAICANCPVRTECLNFALEANERHGIWGGTTPDQRAALRRERGYPRRHSTNTARAEQRKKGAA